MSDSGIQLFVLYTIDPLPDITTKILNSKLNLKSYSYTVLHYRSGREGGELVTIPQKFLYWVAMTGKKGLLITYEWCVRVDHFDGQYTYTQQLHNSIESDENTHSLQQEAMQI